MNYEPITPKIGFIGAGSFAQNFLLPNLKGKCNFISVATSRSHTSKNIAAKYGFDTSTGNADDVINNKEHGSINMQLTGDVIWLKIYVDQSIVVMSGAPNGITAFEPSIEMLDKVRLRLKTGELFAIEYNNPTKNDATQRTAVTGYQMQTGDLVFVKIDTANDIITLYHE